MVVLIFQVSLIYKHPTIGNRIEISIVKIFQIKVIFSDLVKFVMCSLVSRDCVPFCKYIKRVPWTPGYTWQTCQQFCHHNYWHWRTRILSDEMKYLWIWLRLSCVPWFQEYTWRFIYLQKGTQSLETSVHLTNLTRSDLLR